MSQKNLEDKFAENELWFQAQPDMIPWKQGQEKLERINDRILKRNREELLEKNIDRQHDDRPIYSQRLRHCLRHHWEKAQETQPRCRASDVVKAIDQKYKTRNVFNDVVMAVAVVLKEWKAWAIFRPLYDNAFQKEHKGTEKYRIGREDRDVNHDECRETIFGELVSLESDKSGKVKNARLNSYGGEGNFTCWLRITINRRIASYYKRKFEPITPDMSFQSKEQSPSYQVETRDNKAKLRRVMERCLTQEEQNLLEWYYWDKMTLDEICELLKSLKKGPTDKGNLSKKLKEIRNKIKSHWITENENFTK